MTNDQNVSTALNNLWDEFEAGQHLRGEQCADIVFEILLDNLVSVARARGVDSNYGNSSTELLVRAAMVNCTPEGVCKPLNEWRSGLYNQGRPRNLDEGRVRRLLSKAYGLVVCGDEDAVENELFYLHHDGALSDEELGSELATIGIKADPREWVEFKKDYGLLLLRRKRAVESKTGARGQESQGTL
jgi:hypothetical protein